ncbi:hypothetical protein [Actinoplanes sp. NPDC049316]|uniref:hypothetical protein n=1 Tax=Actinoplanes sp. NPDC049316 TaxID=3154727 RepID=UPI003412A3E2
MALIAYDDADAAAFGATRHLGDDALGAWREAITRYVDPRPGMRLLDGITLCRFWPEAGTALNDHYPTVATVEAAFAGAGFVTAGLEPVAQVSAPSLPEAAAGLRREAHTLLQLISDDAYAGGAERLRVAAQTATGPVVDVLDLLVLH